MSSDKLGFFLSFCDIFVLLKVMFFLGVTMKKKNSRMLRMPMFFSSSVVKSCDPHTLGLSNR